MYVFTIKDESKMIIVHILYRVAKEIDQNNNVFVHEIQGFL